MSDLFRNHIVGFPMRQLIYDIPHYIQGDPKYLIPFVSHCSVKISFVCYIVLFSLNSNILNNKGQIF